MGLGKLIERVRGEIKAANLHVKGDPVKKEVKKTKKTALKTALAADKRRLGISTALVYDVNTHTPVTVVDSRKAKPQGDLPSGTPADQRLAARRSPLEEQAYRLGTTVGYAAGESDTTRRQRDRDNARRHGERTALEDHDRAVGRHARNGQALAPAGGNGNGASRNDDGTFHVDLDLHLLQPGQARGYIDADDQE